LDKCDETRPQLRADFLSRPEYSCHFSGKPPSKIAIKSLQTRFLAFRRPGFPFEDEKREKGGISAGNLRFGNRQGSKTVENGLCRQILRGKRVAITPHSACFISQR